MLVNVTLGDFEYQVKITKDHACAYDFTVTVLAMTLVTPKKVNRQEIYNVHYQYRLFNSNPLEKRGSQIFRVGNELPSQGVRDLFNEATLETCKLAMQGNPDWESDVNIEHVDSEIATANASIRQLQGKIDQLVIERVGLLTNRAIGILQTMGSD